MENQRDETLDVLLEIRDILSRIYLCFEDDYKVAKKQKHGEQFKAFEVMLTDVRKKIFPLLFDKKQYSQEEIAQKIGTTQPTVSRFVSALVDSDFIEQLEDENGENIYRDKYDLLKVYFQ